MNSTLLIKRRNTFVNAFFDYLKHKNKSTTFKKTIAGTKYQIDLDAEVLTQALINLYENNICRKECQMNDAQIIEMYTNYYNIKGFLTSDGKAFIQFITESIVENLHNKEVIK